MATKMAVAFLVIFMAHVEKQLLHASPYSHFSGWKKFIDDIFSVWTLPETEINNFIDFANSFQTTIKFTLTNCHQNRLFSLTTEVFKDQDSFDPNALFKPTICEFLLILLSSLKRASYMEWPCTYSKRTRLRNNSR